MDQDSAALKRLGETVTRRRKSLDLTVHEAAVKAPMSPTAWTNVEQGRSVSKATRAGVERVLGWQTGACRAILNGGEPALVSPEQTPSTATQQALQMLELAEQLPPSDHRNQIIADLRGLLFPPDDPPLPDRQRGIG